MAGDTPDPTFDAVALKEAREKGITCKSCGHYRVAVGEPYCQIVNLSFPNLCPSWEYEPGADEHES